MILDKKLMSPGSFVLIGRETETIVFVCKVLGLYDEGYSGQIIGFVEVRDGKYQRRSNQYNRYKRTREYGSKRHVATNIFNTEEEAVLAAKKIATLWRV